MCHVLIIEDDALLALDLESLLSTYGATSFSFAMTEDQAVDLAGRNRPAIITADVRLREGTGPAAVARINEGIGPIPAIFITGTPDECRPCNPPHRVMEKPFDDLLLARAFQEMAFHA
jgi:two-component system, response regulator PdtaR